MNANISEKVQDRARKALVAAFVILIWLPLLDNFFQWDHTSQVQENRALAAFPKFSPGLAGIRNYAHGLELYYNDHFGFRRWLIYHGEQWQRLLFKPAQEYDVIIGREGWLYQANPAASAHHDQNAPFEVQELLNWKALLERRRDWLAQRGIHYIFVVVPTKQTIYPEYLPANISYAGLQNKIDQFFAFMRTNSSVEVVDLRPVLWNAKQKSRLYLMADSHWNQYGSFLAYQELVRRLSAQMPGLEPLPMDAFDQNLVSAKGGNLAMMLMAQDSITEKDCPSLTPRPPLENLRMPIVTVTNGIVTCCENPKQTGTALIFGDSFAAGLFPFLGYHFNRVVCYRLYDGCQLHYLDARLVEKDKPQVVVDQILEAFLGQEDAAEISAKDGLEK